MSFKNWANQEMQSHGSKISFKDWLSHEVKKHGNATLKEWGQDEMKSHNKRYGAEGFAVFGGRGFQIKFDNGYKISIMFGVGNYADHHRGEITMEQWNNPPLKHESRTAEVAVIKPDGDFVRIGANDDVAGWLSPSEVSKLIAATATGDETKIQNALSLDSKSAEGSNMNKKGMLHKLFREQNIPLENVEQLRNSGKRVSGNGTEDYEINLQGDVYNFSLVGTAVDEVGEGYFVLNEVEDANRKYYKGKPHIFDYSMEYEKPLKSLSKFSRLVYGNMKNAENEIDRYYEHFEEIMEVKARLLEEEDYEDDQDAENDAIYEVFSKYYPEIYDYGAETEESNFGSVGEGNNFGQMRAESKNMKTVGAIAVGGAIGMALFGLITGKNLFTKAKDSLKQSAEAKKDCHSCNTNGSVRKNHTQVLSSEYSVGQINPVEVEGQNDVHGAEGITNPRYTPNVQPDPHRSKSLRMW